MRRETKLKRPPHTEVVVITVLITFGLVAVGYNTVFFDFYTHKIMPHIDFEEYLPQEVVHEVFSRRVFAFERDEVDYISLHSLNRTIKIVDEQRVDDLVESLNSLHYKVWISGPSARSVIVPMTILVYLKVSVPLKYASAPCVNIGVFNNRIRVINVHFYCGWEFYDRITALWEECEGKF